MSCKTALITSLICLHTFILVLFFSRSKGLLSSLSLSVYVYLWYSSSSDPKDHYRCSICHLIRHLIKKQHLITFFDKSCSHNCNVSWSLCVFAVALISVISCFDIEFYIRTLKINCIDRLFFLTINCYVGG